MNLYHPSYRSDIDGLRGIAVLLVVFFHAFPNWVDAGYYGKGGFIVYDEDIPICAGFIYMTNSNVAWVDWIVSNKQYRVKGKRKEAILLLIDSLTNICKNTAHKYIFSNNNNRFLVDYFVENGYIVGCKNSVELIKKF